MPRRYTEAEIDAYELQPNRDAATGEVVSYAVVVAGDHLGRIRRSTMPRGWCAYTASGSAPVAHVGRGRVARTRQDAVIDLLHALGMAD